MRRIFWWGVAAASLISAVVMQLTQEYIFYAKEAEHLWLNDWMWAQPQLLEPGGVAQLLASACTQFFQFAYVGALVMGLVMGGVVAFGWSIMRRLKLSDCFASLWALTLTFMMLCNEHNYFNIKAQFALLIAMCAGWTYVAARPRLPLWAAALAAAVAVALSYWLAGSAAAVTAAIVLAVIRRPADITEGAAALAALAAMAWLSIRLRATVSWEEALTPLQYYEWPSTYFFPIYAWASVPLAILAGRGLNGVAAITKRQAATATAVIALAALTLVRLYTAVHNDKMYLLRQDEWNARNENWDAIIRSHEGKPYKTAFISYLNLALAEKGQLLERMGDFNPYIVWDEDLQAYAPVMLANHEMSRDALKLQSCVFMKWGGAALANAQKSAFEANVLTPGDADPVELQRMVVTNSIFRSEKTAEKYRRRLDRTTLYKGKSIDVTDAMTPQDALALPTHDEFYLKNYIGAMLQQIVEQTPDNKIAAQFCEALKQLSEQKK